MSSIFEQWEAASAADISLEKMDNLVKDYQVKRAAYEEASKIKKEKGLEKDMAEAKLLSYMQQGNKKTYTVDGLGTVTRRAKYSSRVPRDLDSNEQLIEYFKSQGRDMFLTYVSVNSQKLNKYFNDMLEDDPSFTLPGCEAPTATDKISWSKKK